MAASICFMFMYDNPGRAHIHGFSMHIKMNSKATSPCSDVACMKYDQQYSIARSKAVHSLVSGTQLLSSLHFFIFSCAVLAVISSTYNLSTRNLSTYTIRR